MLCAKPTSLEELDVKVEAATDGVLPDEVANALQVTKWLCERQAAECNIAAGIVRDGVMLPERKRRLSLDEEAEALT